MDTRSKEISDTKPTEVILYRGRKMYPATLESRSDHLILSTSDRKTQASAVVIDVLLTQIKSVRLVDSSDAPNNNTGLASLAPIHRFLWIFTDNGKYVVDFNSSQELSRWVKKFRFAGIQVTDLSMRMPYWQKLLIGLGFSVVVFGILMYLQNN